MSESKSSRISTGIPELDNMLAGGLLGGRITVVLGATGIGKSQLGVQFADAGLKQEGERGFFFDMTSRGDTQNHNDYAERLFDWKLREMPQDFSGSAETLWDREQSRFDIAHLFQKAGRRVTRNDLDTDEYREWQTELTRKLDQTIRFFYANFVHGARRCVIDGVEPTDRPSDSFQFDLFEYVQHQILKKDAAWVARDLLRAQYRQHAEQVATHEYDPSQLGCLVLCTTREVMLEDLIQRPLDSGDILSNANTIILMGKTRDGLKMGRALYVAKHRGSACSEQVVPYEIGERGLRLLENPGLH
ncbi:MAG: RAD55 family ATPase [Rubinisphaera brasiliensis]|uniref:RAD55 family ATPase n=1 Tax=Rubinisphaera brasiliensis TaxID=119 RepID=UPI003919B555